MVREAIHAVFLYHAVRAGLRMGIVNAGQPGLYEELAAEPERVDDGIVNRDDATSASSRQADRPPAREARSARKTFPGATRLSRNGSATRS